MKRTKPPAKQRGLSFSAPLIDEIKDFIVEKPEYRSVTSFIRDAIREKIYRETICPHCGKKLGGE